MSGAGRPPSPPWRWPGFTDIVGVAGYDDVEARRLWLDAMLAADAADTLGEVAAALDVKLRTLYRARDWLREHTPEDFARLRERVALRPDIAAKRAARGKR